MSLHDEPESAPPAAVPVPIGEVVDGKFRVQALVGRGGMASVMAAHHLELDRPVALKFLDESESARPEAVRRFLAEGRAAARLESVHVAKVLDVGTWRNARGQVLPYLVMELLEGCDLDAVLAGRGRLAVAEAVEYVLQACEAVAEAHAAGIVHRDLKPGNLFLTRKRDGSPVIKLLDFGISKSTLATAGANPNAKGLTADRELMGSPGYMSPEQIRSAKDVDARTDIWSLGVVLYELLCNQMPFESDTIADLLVEVLHSPPQPIAMVAPEVPPALAEVVVRCLQKRREDRFASIDDLARALAPFRSTTPLVIPELARRVDIAPAEAAVASTIHEPPRGNRFLVPAMIAVTAIVLGVGGVALSRRASARIEAKSAVSAAEPPVAAAGSIPPPPSADPTSSAPASAPSMATAETASAPPAVASSASTETKHKPRPTKPAPRPAAAVPSGRPVPQPATPPQRTNW